MADLDIAVDVSLLEALEFEPGCEGALHPESEHGHRAEAPATWLLNAPCGEQALLCDGRIQFLLASPNILCGTCDDLHATHTFRFIPIGTP